MKFFPQINGIWYGVPLVKGQLVELDGNLARKAQERPDLFKRPGRKPNDQDRA